MVSKGIARRTVRLLTTSGYFTSFNWQTKNVMAECESNIDIWKGHTIAQKTYWPVYVWAPLNGL